MEVNRLLLREQSGLQRKVASLETQLTQEKERSGRRKAEVSDVITKVCIAFQCLNKFIKYVYLHDDL